MPAVMAVVGGGDPDFPAKLTKQVLICSIIAAFGGLMFGYDIGISGGLFLHLLLVKTLWQGISGGVTSMDDFLMEFFPAVYVRKHKAKENNYCKYDNELLQLFTSSLYLAAVVCSFFASKSCKKFGRKPTMQLASLFFFTGVVLNTAALNLPMLIVGRLCLGAGVGFGNQANESLFVNPNLAVPLFISEIAPPKYRGGLNICFQMLITVGILCANLVNYGTSRLHPWGWRVSLGGAGFPALFLGLGSLLIDETPTSLIERGHKEKGLETLKKIRGVENVEKEYQEIVWATQLATKMKHPFRTLMKRSSRPQLVCGTILQVFQQFTGINVIMFYAPVLFQTMGFGADASLLSAVITGSVNSLATLVAIFGVDKLGRRFFLIQAAVQNAHFPAAHLAPYTVDVKLILGEVLSWKKVPQQNGRRVRTTYPSGLHASGPVQAAGTDGGANNMECITGGILLVHLKTSNSISKHYAYILVMMICVFVSGFAWSWGPLGWLIPSEIYPLETRPAGFFFAVSTNMIFTFLIAQAFLTMLCHMRSGTFFFFFSVWIVIMGLFAIFLLPETKGIPIDEMNERVWKKHWFWKRYFVDVCVEEDQEVAKPTDEKA
ncbi:hypothetical protein RJ639_040989 [Escallonia herrerae]|uniref:Major facilitator superfamily (MFS) profile domain-containing protein n=1 Tax=Escallonia herrerae TaxID=1293975 RepID=A0AA88WEG5_9ASTE|nr:hypothetical protein RJ639_040989 [Escallonia herrerae]